MSKLTPKQEMFCREYLIDLNATQAYIRAGYQRKGAEANSSRLIANDKVQARVAQLLEKRTQAVQYDAEALLRDMLEVLAVAKERAVQGDSRDLTAYKGLADSVGKHQGVGAFIEKHDHTSSDGSMTPTAIERVIVYPEGEGES